MQRNKLESWIFVFTQPEAIFDFNQDYSTAPIGDDLPIAIDSIVWPQIAVSSIGQRNTL
jgi:hypothetical protein